MTDWNLVLTGRSCFILAIPTLGYFVTIRLIMISSFFKTGSFISILSVFLKASKLGRGKNDNSSSFSKRGVVASSKLWLPLPKCYLDELISSKFSVGCTITDFLPSAIFLNISYFSLALLLLPEFNRFL